MSLVELAVNSSKELEHLLETRLGATGKGLHEKLSSVESKLPEKVVKAIRSVATIRNKVVHEHGYRMENPDWFRRCHREAVEHLEGLEPVGGWTFDNQPLTKLERFFVNTIPRYSILFILFVSPLLMIPMVSSVNAQHDALGAVGAVFGPFIITFLATRKASGWFYVGLLRRKPSFIAVAVVIVMFVLMLSL